MSGSLPEGKIDAAVLAGLLPDGGPARPEVLIGAALGEDAAVVTGAARLVMTSDPITLAGNSIGHYAVAVNCNDLVAMGAEPRYLTTTVLLPPGTTRSALEELFAELASAAAGAGIAWVGGHTEVTGRGDAAGGGRRGGGGADRRAVVERAGAPRRCRGADQVGGAGGDHPARPRAARRAGRARRPLR